MKSKFGFNKLLGINFNEILVNDSKIYFIYNDPSLLIQTSLELDLSKFLNYKTSLKKYNFICEELYFFLNKNYISRDIKNIKNSLIFSGCNNMLSNVIYKYLYEFFKK